MVSPLNDENLIPKENKINQHKSVVQASFIQGIRNLFKITFNSLLEEQS